MKTLKFLILSFLFLSIYSCDVETEDIITENATEGGVSLELGANTLGKALGNPTNPSDLDNSTIVFTDVVFNMEVIKRWAGEDVVKYEIYKSINGGIEVKVAESATLPMSLSYSTIEELIAGTQVSDPDDLRIGDLIKFRTKITNSSGESYFIHDGGDYTGTYIITVSCSSDLAGTYDVTTYNLTSGTYFHHGTEVIVETSPGVYKTATTGTWAVGSIAPDQGYNFQDVCGSITIPNQDLCQGYYSNDVFQNDDQQAASYVNGSTGDIQTEYTITFAAGNRDYRSIYVRL